MGDNKFFHISSGIVFDKLDILTNKYDICVDTKDGMYLALLVNSKADDKIRVKDIIELENEINSKINDINKKTKDEEFEK